VKLTTGLTETPNHDKHNVSQSEEMRKAQEKPKSKKIDSQSQEEEKLTETATNRNDSNLPLLEIPQKSKRKEKGIFYSQEIPEDPANEKEHQPNLDSRETPNDKNEEVSDTHPGVNFINISFEPFLYESVLRTFSLLTIWL